MVDCALHVQVVEINFCFCVSCVCIAQIVNLSGVHYLGPDR